MTTTGEAPTTSGAPPATDSGTTAADTSTGAAESSSDGAGSTAADSSGGSDDTAGSDSSGGQTAVCGNNIVEGDEVCDLGQLGGETCQSLGFQGGQLGCLLTCDNYNTLGCFVCGNGVVDLPEDCEDTVPKEVTCESLGFAAGQVTCGADCLYDTSDCSICGDGIRQGPEACDGLDYGGETCESLGFDEGEISCHVPTCSFDYTDCSGGLYFQDFEAGVYPGEFTFSGDADWIIDDTSFINGTFSARSGDIADNQESRLLLTAVFSVDGTVSFWHREDSEGTFDSLEFIVDGVVIESWDGINAAAEFSAPITAGSHDLEWRYEKDGSVSSGLDSVFVDDISLVPGVPG